MSAELPHQDKVCMWLSLTVLKAWECAPGGIGEEEMNTTNSPELDSKTEVYILGCANVWYVVLWLNVECPEA